MLERTPNLNKKVEAKPKPVETELDPKQALKGVDDPHDSWTKTAFQKNARENNKLEKRKAAPVAEDVSPTPDFSTEQIKNVEVKKQTPAGLKEERRADIIKDIEKEWEDKNGPMEQALSESEIQENKARAVAYGQKWDGKTTRLTDKANEFFFDHKGEGKSSVPSQADKRLAEQFPEYAEKANTPVEDYPGTSLTEPVVIDALTRKVREDRKQEAINRAQQDLEKNLANEVSTINKKDAHIGEAEGLLKELARKSNQEALKNQVDEDLKTAAGPEGKPAPAEKPSDDLKAWREYFGPMAEIQEEKEAAEKKEKDTKEWREHFGPELTGQVETEKKMFVPTPEQLKGIESIKAAAAAQETANKQKAEKLGFWGTVKKFRDKANNASLGLQVAAVEGLRTLGQKKGRIAAIVGAGALAYILYKYFNNTPPVDSSTFPPMGDFGSEPMPPMGDFGMDTFGNVAVADGDTVWGMIEDRLSNNSEFMSLGVEQQTHAIDEYKDYLQSLDKNTLSNIGIKSGDIDKIQRGWNIDLSILNELSFRDIMEKAKNLTPEQISSIRYNLDHGIR